MNKNIIKKDIEPVVEHIERDFSKLSQSQIHEILEKEVPDLLKYYNKLKEIIPDFTDRFQKLLEKSNENKLMESGKNYIQFKNSLILNFIYNFVFYSLVKSSGKDPRIHPVSSHLQKIYGLIEKIEDIDNKVINEIDEYLDGENSEEESENSNEEKSEEKSEIESDENKIENNFEEEEEDDDDEETDLINNNNNLENDSESSENDDEYQFIDELRKNRKRKYIEKPITEVTNGPRKITESIMKNRGLTPYKNRKIRNPRAKKRAQYEKALKRRKGAVQSIRTGETNRYGGEQSGIRSDIVHSRMINN